MDVCLLWVLCVVRRCLCEGLIPRPEEPYRLWCVWVWSRNLVNEEALVHWGAVEPNKKSINWLFYQSLLRFENFLFVFPRLMLRFRYWSKRNTIHVSVVKIFHYFIQLIQLRLCSRIIFYVVHVWCVLLVSAAVGCVTGSRVQTHLRRSEVDSWLNTTTKHCRRGWVPWNIRRLTWIPLTFTLCCLVLQFTQFRPLFTVHS